MSNKLVIVESPAKARTISNYLGAGYTVKASIGHIRDLPQPSELPAEMKKGPYGKFAVDTEHGFTPYYVVSSGKKKIVSELKADLKEADELFLATDEDREGEAIAWHLREVLKPKVPVKRMVFHEITKEAIQRALTQTRQIDQHLVDAQETRRILDRLVGYEISPLLWRKVAAGLSAGRVQSVATRLVVDRERERMAFKPAKYFGLEGEFAKAGSGEAFKASLRSIGGVKLATGADFGADGQLKREALLLDGELCQQVAGVVLADGAAGALQVTSVESKPYSRKPAAPFTTSTLQQEAGRKLRMGSRQTMQVAQSLYENGYITYMRTDSTALSEQAVKAARKQAADMFGAQNVAAHPRVYAKKAKGAQEAHEAIRPAGDTFRTPMQVAAILNPSELALYDLIWKRTIASQMQDAKGTTDTVRVGMNVPLAALPALAGAQGAEGVATDAASAGVSIEFGASGTVITSPGFMLAYEEGTDEKGEKGKSRQERRLPALGRGESVSCLNVDLEGSEHTTTPPARYTEASLVKTLEEKGVGRPSTYASTIGVIIDRGYVERAGQALVPSWLAFSVVRLLEQNLSSLIDYDFTADMEEDLDRIAAGQLDGQKWLADFWFGSLPRGEARPEGLAKSEAELRQWGLERTVDSLGEIDAKALNSIEVAPGVNVRVGRYGPYLETEDGQRASVPVQVLPDELTPQKVADLLAAGGEDGRELGVDPASGHMIIAKNGRFGPYVTEVLPDPQAETESAEAKGAEAEGGKAEKPKRTRKTAAPKPRTASLFKSMDLATVTLGQALQLLSLPRVLGVDPESGDEITAQNGRFGPYLKKGSDSRSLTDEEQLLTITFEQALEIYKQPKTRGRAAAKPPLAEFGADPVSGKIVKIKDGRFGPYITDGVTNITVPRLMNVEDVTEEQAFQLLAEKRAKVAAAPEKKTAAKKTTAKKVTTKKATTKKATAKKSTSKKATASEDT